MPAGSYSEQRLRQIFRSTSGKCHLCGEPLSFSDYGRSDPERGWEVDHSRPRADGGTDHLNNLYPAHVTCNRRRGRRSVREVRAENGLNRPPFSESERKEWKEREALGGGMAGASVAAVCGLGPVGVLGSALLAGECAYRRDPDEVEATVS